MKPDNSTYLLQRTESVDYFPARWTRTIIASSNMKLETPPTQLSGGPSQTSTAPKLLSAHSDSGRLNSIVNVSCGPCINIRYPIHSGSDRIAHSTI